MNDRLCGLLIPVFALRAENDMGIGDTACLMDAIAFCADARIGLIQVLPVNETGGDNSPYNAISSVALDPALLSMTADMVPGLTRAIIGEIARPELLAELRQGPVRYKAVKALKGRLLREAYDNFKSGLLDKEPGESFRLFVERQAHWLDSYTLFRTIMAEHDGVAVWSQWEEEIATYDRALAWLHASADRERLEDYRNFCAYVQWVAFSQWRRVRQHADENGVRLMGDIPFGVSRYSADVWADRQLFDLSWSGGAPPEIFFQTDRFTSRWGQNWGIPLYDWQAHEKEHFRWWRQRVESVSEFFHYFRIDHVLGFFRVYAFPWIPERNGEFVDLEEEEAMEKAGGRLPQFRPRPDEPWDSAEENAREGQALLKMVVEAAGETGVVAEDLGVVPDYVRPVLASLSIPGFYIPQFERVEPSQEFKPAQKIPELSLGTYATHDHLPLAAYYNDLVQRWQGQDGHSAWLELQRLMRFLSMDDHHPPREYSDELHERLLSVLLLSPCRLAVLMVTDMLCTSQRFNAPGSSTDSNWSERLDRPLPEYLQDPVYRKRIRLLADLIEKSGRAHRQTARQVL